jgi:hypothetical protein
MLNNSSFPLGDSEGILSPPALLGEVRGQILLVNKADSATNKYKQQISLYAPVP